MNTETHAQLAAMFAPLKAQVAEDFVNFVSATLGRLIEKHGAKLEKLVHEWGADASNYRALRHLVIRKGENNPALSYYEKQKLPRDYVVDTERLARESLRYAEQQVEAMVLKMAAKLEGATELKLLDAIPGRLECCITGVKAGHSFSITQSRTLNCSSKGRLFHQWPARFRVDGKAATEASFKALSA